MILVTGASGFIGENLVRYLAGRGLAVVGVDVKPFAGDAPLPPGLAFEPADLGNAAVTTALIEKHRPETLVALAEAYSGAPVSIVEETAARHGALLESAASAGVKRLLFASSIAVYMGLDGPFREDMPLPVESPMHVSAVKKVGEHINHWHNLHGAIEIISMRLANIYGPRYHSMMNLPSRALFTALGRELPPSLPALPPHFYKMAADYCYIEDCCDAILKLIEAPALAHRCYNIGGGAGVGQEDIVAAVAGTACDGGPPVANYLDIARLSEELGYAPKFDIGSGVAAYRVWLEHNPR